MNLADIELGAGTIPAFITVFGMGWAACVRYLVKPLEKRVEGLEARDQIYRKEVDEELKAYRQRVHG